MSDEELPTYIQNLVAPGEGSPGAFRPLGLVCLAWGLGGVVGSAIAWLVSKFSEASVVFLGAAPALGRASEEVRMLGCAGWPTCLLVSGCF
jgi:hypothetical protein